METRSSVSRSLHTNRDLEKLEPYEGKPSCTVLRGEEGSNALDLPDRPADMEQRNGRARRKGNTVKFWGGNVVDIIIYGTEKTLDAYKFNLALPGQDRRTHQLFVEFRSHIDGSKHLFTPERVMDIGQQVVIA